MTSVLVAAGKNTRNAMVPENKDLTGVFPVSGKPERSSSEDPSSDNLEQDGEKSPLDFQETPIEQLSSFESLQELAETSPESSSDSEFQNSTGFESSSSEEENAHTSPISESDFGPMASEPISAESQPTEMSSIESTSPDSLSIDPLVETAEARNEPAILQEESEHESGDTTQKQSATPLERIKNYSERTAIDLPPIPAAFPFSVLITGSLKAHERERLLDLLAREKMGIREIDLEPQIAGGRILIPRVSEYAAVMVVQALRGIDGKIQFGPSDTIFSTADTHEDSSRRVTEVFELNTSTTTSETSHPAENIPVTSESELPGLPRYKVIDTITASAALKSKVVEAEASPEYQQIIEALHRELKYKAFRKGASAIINFKIQLSLLSSPTHYRVLAIGQAIAPADFPPVTEN